MNTNTKLALALGGVGLRSIKCACTATGVEWMRETVGLGTGAMAD